MWNLNLIIQKWRHIAITTGSLKTYRTPISINQMLKSIKIYPENFKLTDGDLAKL